MLDVGCGTGFMEQFFQGVVTRTYAADATFNMLAIGKNKYSTDNVSWVNADASQLPFQRESFDMVCSNAVLHHVYDYSNILREMVSLLRPGGRLFIGYEPNAIAYRLFYPVLMFLARFVPERSNKERIEELSGQNEIPRLADKDLAKLTEFHIYYGKGIHPYRLKEELKEMGLEKIKLHFSIVYQIALLRDVGIPTPMMIFPDWLFKLTGPLSLSFSLTAAKQG